MTLSKLSLKKPDLENLEAVVELDKLCLDGLWSLKGYQRELESPSSSLVVLTLPESEKIIGCGCFWAILEEAHITIMAIHPDYQGQGLGKLLLYGLMENAVRRALERATLEVKASNTIALSLYEKFGFQIAGRRKGYYEKTGEDALILWLSGLEKPQFSLILQKWHQEISDRLLVNNWTWEMITDNWFRYNDLNTQRSNKQAWEE